MIEKRRGRARASGQPGGWVWLQTLVAVALMQPWLCAGALTQQSPLVRRISIEQGLPSSEIYALAEDRHGYLWLGTDAGLVRYDGREFVRWQIPGVASGTIEQVLIDQRDHLWFSMTEVGLMELNPARELVRQFSVERTPGWSSNDVWALHLAADGDLWVGTYLGGLIDLQVNSGEFTLVPLEGVSEPWSVLALTTDREGSLWVGTYGRGLLSVAVGDSVAKAHPFTESGRHQVDALAPADEGVWVAARDRGICQYDSERGWRCPERPEDLQQIGDGKAMVVNGNGELWVSRSRGISMRSREGHWRHFQASTGSPFGLPPRRLIALHLDPDGGLWIGTEGAGLAYISPLSQRVQAWVSDASDPKSLPPSRIRAVAADEAGLWIGTFEFGLFRFNGHDQLTNRLPQQRLSANRIQDLGTTADGALWVTHEQGLSRLSDYPGEDLHWPTSEFGQGLADLIFPLGESQVLVSVYGSGTWLAGPGELLPVESDERKPTQLEDVQSGHGQIWVASERGLHRFEPACGCLIWLDLSDQRSYALAADGRGWWVAVDGAIVHFVATPTGWKLARSLEWSGRPPGGMRVDPLGRLWASGPEGLFVLEKDAISWRRLGSELGVVAAEMSSRPFESDGESLLLPSDRGLLRVNPRALPSAPILRSLKLIEASVFRQGERVQLALDALAAVEAGDGDLVIRLGSPLLGEAHSLRFLSRVDGLDPDWVELADGRRTLGVLPAGRYEFHGQVFHPANRDLRLETSWSFEVLAPWWRRWPALITAVGLVALLLVLIQRAMARANQRRQRQDLEIEQLVWAERNAAEKSAFLAHISHEIRNPLSGMLGLLQMAERESSGPQRSRLALARAAGAQIHGLLEDVFVWSRVQRGDLSVRLHATHVAALAAEVAERHRPLAADLSMPLQLEGDQRLQVMADRKRLMQILDNLLGNALKFCEGGRLLLSWEAIDDRQALIALSDEGPGIPAQAAQRIFDEREQTVSDSRGLGLGLNIARQLARRMGGDLRLNPQGWAATGLSSGGGPGSRFELVLTRAPDQSQPQPIDAQAGPIAAVAVAGARPVMLVEDDAIQRARWVEELGGAGIPLVAHANALTALSELIASPAAALITDLGLPEVDGLQLIQLVRAHPSLSGMPILVMTARALAADQSAALEAGADEVLIKPVLPESVIEWIERVTQEQRAPVEAQNA